MSSRIPSIVAARWIGGFSLVLLAASGTGCRGTAADGAHRSEKPRVAVQTIVLQPAQLPRLLTAVGTIESPQTTLLASEVEGTVTFLDIPEGQQVEAGRVLVKVDDRRSQAKLSIAEARHRNARETYDRLRSLHGGGLISKQELDDAMAEFEQAVGSLEDARTALEQTEISAPFTGRLGLREISLGAYLSSGDPVVRLTQTKPVRLVFSVPEREVALVRVGQPVRGLAGDCRYRFEAVVSVVDPTLAQGTRSVLLQATIPNEDGTLVPGMSARVAIEVGAISDALSVPQEAVVRRGTKKILYVVAGDNSIEERLVTLGQYATDRVEVRTGVTAGEQVVVAGHQRIRPGALADAKPYRPVQNPKLSLGFPDLGSCDL